MGGFVPVGVNGTNLFSLPCCAWQLSLLIVLSVHVCGNWDVVVVVVAVLCCVFVLCICPLTPWRVRGQFII